MSESYTVEQIREAFAKYATKDEWSAPTLNRTVLINALRGEYDEKPKPVYAHDCDECTFLGHREGHDLYVHHATYPTPFWTATYIARYGSGGEDYTSGKRFVDQVDIITLAHDLATEQGIALNIEED